MAEPRVPPDHESDGEQSGGYTDRPANLEPIRAIARPQNDHVYQPKTGVEARAASADEP